MRIVVITVGSRGDVQPFVALARGLAVAGYDAVVATHDNFEGFVTDAGVGFASIGGDARLIVQGGAGLDWIETGHNPLAFARGFRSLLGPHLQRGMVDALTVAEGAGAILCGGPAFFLAHSVAEKLRVPLIQAYLQPIHPTTAFPSPLVPTRLHLGPLFNLATHLAGGIGFWHLLRPLLNRTRADVLGLRPYALGGPFLRLMRDRAPVLYGYSPTVVPKPRRWGDYIHVTGYWFLDHPDWRPPDELTAFLAAGPPPISVGFGSMGDRDPARTTGVVLDALDRAGQRGILLSGWAGLAEGALPPTVMRLEAAPHDRLFPHVAAVVHHGGAGTSAAGLRAGRPSVTVPFFADQPFWAERIRLLGAGPPPVDRRRLSADTLAAAVRQAVDDPRLRAGAAAAGERIRAEDGVGNAVAAVRAYLGAA